MINLLQGIFLIFKSIACMTGLEYVQYFFLRDVLCVVDGVAIRNHNHNLMS